MSPRHTTPQQDLFRGIWRENPVLIQMLGLCPALAVTNTVANSLVMGIATFFVLVGSSLLVSIVKKLVPNEVRISTYILIIATFVTVADMTLEAIVPAPSTSRTTPIMSIAMMKPKPVPKASSSERPIVFFDAKAS